MNKSDIVKQQSDFILYTGNDGKVNVDVFVQDETIWLTQNAIGKLFGKSKATISEHLTKIYAEGELEMDSTVRKFRTVDPACNSFDSNICLICSLRFALLVANRETI